MKKIIVIVLFLAIVPAYLFYQKSNKEEQREMENKKVEEIVQETTPTPALAMHSIVEIEKHSTKEDCWFAIEGKVYDVTKVTMSGKHPGGEAILEGCGKDATVLFNTRPMGSGTEHSDKARDSLANFIIGDLSK